MTFLQMLMTNFLSENCIKRKITNFLSYFKLLEKLNYNQNILIEVHSQRKLQKSIEILNNYITLK